jgi:hypothetical protein
MTMTTGRKFAKRTNDTGVDKVLDQRTRIILNTVAKEPRGRMLAAYINALGQK